jgi:enoyl-CoA hydratase
MTEPTVLRTDHGPVRFLTLNRPRVRNAIDIATMRLMHEEVARASDNDSVRAIVINGKGGVAFSAGGDMAEMIGFSPLSADTLMHVWQKALECIARSPKPVIAAVEGFAYGGGTELALACHFRVASDDARFGQTEIALDHLPGGGGTQRLPRLVPLGFAYEHLMLGDPISAQEAWRVGLVNHVWPKSEFLDRTLALAQRIAQRSPTAIRFTLEAIREGLNGSLDVGLRLERAMAGLVLESAEARKGLEEFLEKKRGAKAEK